LASTRVVDFCEPRVFIPEAFTPNGDGANDLLDVYSTYTSGFEIKIFNRWGEVVFTSNEPENIKWDGTYRGAVYPPMMYAYVISYGSKYDPEMPRVVRRGSVLLIR
jgi:gliding motility-associated-like protein